MHTFGSSPIFIWLPHNDNTTPPPHTPKLQPFWSFDGGARGIRNAMGDLSTSGQSLDEGAVV